MLRVSAERPAEATPRASSAPGAAAVLAASVLAIGLVLTGCSSSADTAGAAREHASAPAGRTPAAPGATGSAATTGGAGSGGAGSGGAGSGGATTGGAAGGGVTTGGATDGRAARPTATAWPTAPSGPDRIPPSVATAPMAAGYTGGAFLDALARTWHITLPARKKTTPLSGKPVWVRSGVAHPAKNQTVAVDAVWDQAGDLQSLVCRATSGYTAFLRACLRLDYPGAKPQAALDWLAATTPVMDAAFEKSSEQPVVSPLFRNGPTATHLDEQNVKEYGGRCRMISTFGAAPGAAL